MNGEFVATAETTIEADRLSVWKALVTPEAIERYMFGAEVESDWKVGSRITWSGEFEGREYEDRGEIVRIEPGQVLSYTHFSPLAGRPDEPENYHTVTIELSEDHGTTTVSLSQDNNPTEESCAESAKNWRAMLLGLKEYVEDSSR